MEGLPTPTPHSKLADVPSTSLEKHESSASGHSDEDVQPIAKLTPPDGGYGWVVVACQTTINAMTWGLNASYAVYLSHFTAPGSSYFKGTTTLQYTFVGGVSVGMALFSSPIATLLNNKYGHRVPMLIGCVLEATAFICASFAHNFWELFMAQGVLFGISMGLLFTPSVGIPSQWFTRRRALATGICAGGSGLGGIIFNLGTNAMIINISLEWAYRITAIIVLVANLTATLLTREFTPRTGPRTISVRKSLFDHTVFRFKGYNYILAWGIMSLFGYVTLQFSISKYAVSALGLTQTQASNLAALLSAGMAIGRPVLGFIGDTYGRINSGIFFTFVSGMLCLCMWLPAGSYGVMIAFALIEGTVAGTFWSSVIPITAEIVGMSELGGAASIVWLVMSIPCTFATTIALEIVGDSNDYERLIGFAGGCYIVAAALLIGAKMHKQRSQGRKAFKIFLKT